MLFCYTATNIAMLCCTASILGGILRRIREQRRGRTPIQITTMLLSMCLQGIIVYLVMISGIISFAGWNPFIDSPDQNQYMRLAGTSSLISIMIGYSPGLFNSLLGKLEDRIEKKQAAERGNHAE